MAKPIKVVFLGDTKDLEKSFKDADKQATGFGDSMKKLGVAAVAGAAVAGAAILKFGVDSIKSFMDDEKVVAQFNRVIENIAPAMRPNIAELEKWNSKLSINLALDDEAILSAEGLALQYGATKDQIKDLVVTAADLSTAMGVDLDTAMTTVLKSSEGSTKAFKELGIDAFKPTGDRAKDLTTAMELLNAKVGGAAAVAADTAAAAMERLKNSFSNIQSGVGEQLIKAFFPGVIEGLTGKKAPSLSSASVDAATRMEELAKKIADAGESFRDFGIKVGEALKKLKELYDFVKGGSGLFELVDQIWAPKGSKQHPNVIKPVGQIPESLRGTGRQHGGPVTAGQGYMVGEQGPEWFTPGTSGAISGRSRGSGGTNVNVYVSGSVLAERDLSDAIRNALTSLGRLNVSAVGGLA